MEQTKTVSRTAAEAGWHISNYNLTACDPETGRTVIANLMAGSCEVYSPLELFLLNSLDRIDEHHPIMNLLARRGLICNYDELAAFEARGRIECAKRKRVGLVICPTMGCNFDCPYCFETHRPGKMSPEVQDDVVALAARMLDTSATQDLDVTWFGGEPLLAADVIESLSERLIALVDERGGDYMAGIITNGYLLTQSVADMLERVRVNRMQVTLDGLAASHDATRPLAGGGPTFGRIVSNLRENRLPFCTTVRHNVHTDNLADMEPLKALVGRIAKESGNKLYYYPARVHESDAADMRGCGTSVLCGESDTDVGIAHDAERFTHAKGIHCGVHSIWGVCIDASGRLHMCRESVDKPELSFGTAHDWDPAHPLVTASKLDNLTCYLSAGSPVADPECRACVWLPQCAGGCPYQRLFGRGRACVPYRDDPEAFVLAVHAQKKAKIL